jgi:hypothetical protein
MTNAKYPQDDEPIRGEDETNGLAGDLEGDDGGAIDETDHSSVFSKVLGGDTSEPTELAPGETRYSEEEGN